MPSQIQIETEPYGQLAKSYQELLYALSHDLPAPLRSILGFSKLLDETHREQLNEDAQDYLDRVQHEAKGLQVMLDQLLILARIQYTEPSLETIDGKELVTRVLDNLESVIKNKAATVKIQDNFPQITVHPDWAQLALFHLVENALKFHQSNQSPYIEIAPFKASGFVITDNGIGVAPSFAESIFGLFRRAVGREYPGIGAGLKIAQTIAHQHGGNVRYQPTQDGGSVFVITFND